MEYAKASISVFLDQNGRTKYWMVVSAVRKNNAQRRVKANNQTYSNG